MPEWTTIPLTPETKKLLEELKKRYNISTYDELIRQLTTPGETVMVDLSKTVPPATAILWNENYYDVQWDGTLTQVTLHFPKGCNGLVDVRVGVKTSTGLVWVVPSVGFIALDDTTQSYSIQFPVYKGDRIVAEIYNYDDTYEHRIGIIIGLQRRPVVRI